jgi:mRNA-degrading endonuclease RelE of RelBE toxin-antitoxin system
MTDSKVLLSSGAAAELKKLSSRDKSVVYSTIERLAKSDISPEVRVLRVKESTSPYLIARSGHYRIIFRYLEPDESPNDRSASGDSLSRDILIAAVIRAGQALPAFLKGDR